MVKPIVPRKDDGTFTHKDIVWWSRLDKRYLVEVRRSKRGTYTADLFIFDCCDNYKELKHFEVGLSYGARFGPDAADIAEWRGKVADFIDDR